MIASKYAKAAISNMVPSGANTASSPTALSLLVLPLSLMVISPILPITVSG